MLQPDQSLRQSVTTRKFTWLDFGRPNTALVHTCTRHENSASRGSKMDVRRRSGKLLRAVYRTPIHRLSGRRTRDYRSLYKGSSSHVTRSFLRSDVSYLSRPGRCRSVRARKHAAAMSRPAQCRQVYLAEGPVLVSAAPIIHMLLMMYMSGMFRQQFQ